MELIRQLKEKRIKTTANKGFVPFGLKCKPKLLRILQTFMLKQTLVQ